MLTAFFQHLESEKRYSAHTIRAYRSDLKQLVVDLAIPEAELMALTHKDLRQWCASLMEHGLSARSVNRKISSVSAYFTFLVRQKALTQNPVEKMIKPKNTKRLPYFYDEKEMQEMLDADVVLSDDYIAARNHVILELFYGTGMRLSELAGLRYTDVNIARLTVKVLGKGNKERVLPLSQHLVRELKRYLDNYRRYFDFAPETALFVTISGAPLSVRTIYGVVHRALGKSGITGKRSPHVLRHTFATHLLNNGADLGSIKNLLGHSTMSTTQVYTHNDIEKLLQSYSQAHPHA
jgi:integrase/recombinase XerC